MLPPRFKDPVDALDKELLDLGVLVQGDLLQLLMGLLRQIGGHPVLGLSGSASPGPRRNSQRFRRRRGSRGRCRPILLEDCADARFRGHLGVLLARYAAFALIRCRAFLGAGLAVIKPTCSPTHWKSCWISFAALPSGWISKAVRPSFTASRKATRW